MAPTPGVPQPPPAPEGPQPPPRGSLSPRPRSPPAPTSACGPVPAAPGPTRPRPRPRPAVFGRWALRASLCPAGGPVWPLPRADPRPLRRRPRPSGRSAPWEGPSGPPCSPDIEGGRSCCRSAPRTVRETQTWSCSYGDAVWATGGIGGRPSSGSHVSLRRLGRPSPHAVPLRLSPRSRCLLETRAPRRAWGPASVLGGIAEPASWGGTGNRPHRRWLPGSHDGCERCCQDLGVERSVDALRSCWALWSEAAFSLSASISLQCGQLASPGTA